MEADILACKNSTCHGDKWLLSSTGNERDETLPCFACCMLSLQDKQQLGLRKRMILSYLKDLMASNVQILINVVSSDDQVIIPTVQVLLSLLNYNEEHLSKLSGECLLLFLIHLKKEGLGLAVMQRLTVEIEEESNYSRSVTHFYMLGRLLQIFPDLVKQGKCTETKFLLMLANGLSYPSDDVRSVILILLSQIYQNAEKNNIVSRSLDAVFTKNILGILKKSQNRIVLKSALGLLKLFISKVLKSFDVLFDISEDEIRFTDVIKKLLLSNQQDFQVCVVQCICHLLKNSSVEKQIPLLLEANIPEILFDVISIKSELLLESVLCCLHLFVHGAADATKCHLVFGIEIITDVACSLIPLKNWRLLSLSMNLLTSIISNNEYLMTSSHITFFYQVIQLTEKAFKVQNPAVLLTVCKFFTEFLKKKNLSWILPLEQIYNNVDMCLKAVSKFISSVSAGQIKTFEDSKSLPLEMEILVCSLDMLSSCISLCKDYSLNPVSAEREFSCPKVVNVKESANSSNEKSTEPLLLLCLSTADEIFIPYCLILLKNVLVCCHKSLVKIV